jgi:hypothetical protein
MTIRILALRKQWKPWFFLNGDKSLPKVKYDLSWYMLLALCWVLSSLVDPSWQTYHTPKIKIMCIYMLLLHSYAKHAFISTKWMFHIIKVASLSLYIYIYKWHLSPNMFLLYISKAACGASGESWFGPVWPWRSVSAFRPMIPWYSGVLVMIRDVIWVPLIMVLDSTRHVRWYT